MGTAGLIDAPAAPGTHAMLQLGIPVLVTRISLIGSRVTRVRMRSRNTRARSIRSSPRANPRCRQLASERGGWCRRGIQENAFFVALRVLH
jgi:hypothetical protein